MQSFRLETVIAAPVADRFDLNLSVDANTASMGPSAERAVAGVTSGEMGLGDTVTWRARHVGIPFRMTSAITMYERPVRFVDEQQHGPLSPATVWATASSSLRSQRVRRGSSR